MLKIKENKYVVIDFKTTWNTILQITLKEFDKNFKQINKYSTYIKEDNNIELNELVVYNNKITSDIINKEWKLLNKNKIKEIINDSILIWNNILYVLSFLNKKINEKLTPKNYFDVIEYSKVLLHFQSSYDIEVIADKLWLLKGDYNNTEYSTETIFELFKYLILLINSLVKKYPSLQNLFLKTKGNVFKDIFELKKVKNNIFRIPRRRKQLSMWNIKRYSDNITKELKEYKSGTVFNISDWKENNNIISIKDIIDFSTSNEKNIVIVVDNYDTLWILKNKINDLWLFYNFLNNENTIDVEKEKIVLEQKELNNFETNYITKLFSLYENNIPFIDINDNNELKIHTFLLKWKKTPSKWMLLATQNDFFNYIKNQENKKYLKNYKIIFLNQSSLLSWLNNVVNDNTFILKKFLKKIDLLEYINILKKDKNNIETLNKIKNNITNINEKLIKQIEIMLRQKISNKNINNLLVNSLSNYLSKEENTYIENSVFEDIEKINDKDYIELINNLKKDLQAFKGSILYWCILNTYKKNYNEYWISFTDDVNKENIDINYFKDLLDWLLFYTFSSYYNKNYISLNEIIKKKTKKEYSVNIELQEKKDFVRKQTFEKYIDDNKKIFYIIDNNNIKDLYIFFNKYLESKKVIWYRILAEWINGNQWKNVYLSWKRGKKITIGSVNLFKKILKNNIKYDKLIVLHEKNNTQLQLQLNELKSLF